MTEQVDERVPFTAADGVSGAVTNVRLAGGPRPTKGPVLLVHGASVRPEIFRPPTPTTLVDVLLATGYDVWLETWRASMDVPNNTWNLDQAAVLDHPLAVRTVLERTGASSIQAVVHCQGSTSFLMSACAGLVPEVRTIVSSAVALHPVVPRMAKLKLDWVVPVASRMMGYLDPCWGEPGGAPGVVPKVVTAVAKLSRRTCDNGVCKMASFIFGAGDPTLWTHEQLGEVTHEWIRSQFGPTPLSFFRQIARCVAAGRLLSVDGRPELPADFTAQAPRTDARFSFMTGSLNHCFLPESQERSFEWFDRLAPGRHSLHIVPGYGHLDVFLGLGAAKDWFPLIVAELDKD